VFYLKYKLMLCNYTKKIQCVKFLYIMYKTFDVCQIYLSTQFIHIWLRTGYIRPI